MKNILLTGAARGLGLAIAERLAASGEYRVIGIGRTLSDEYLSLMDSNASLSFYSFDLNDLDEISGLVSSITSDYGALYGVVNNAGIGLDGVLATQHNSEISRVLRVNLEAAILMTKYGCRSMLRHRTGRIVNISSIIASTGCSGLAAYAACLLYTSPSPRDLSTSRMPSSA